MASQHRWGNKMVTAAAPPTHGPQKQESTPKATTVKEFTQITTVKEKICKLLYALLSQLKELVLNSHTRPEAFNSAVRDFSQFSHLAKSTVAQVSQICLHSAGRSMATTRGLLIGGEKHKAEAED